MVCEILCSCIYIFSSYELVVVSSLHRIVSCVEWAGGDRSGFYSYCWSRMLVVSLFRLTDHRTKLFSAAIISILFLLCFYLSMYCFSDHLNHIGDLYRIWQRSGCVLSVFICQILRTERKGCDFSILQIDGNIHSKSRQAWKDWGVEDDRIGLLVLRAACSNHGWSPLHVWFADWGDGNVACSRLHEEWQFWWDGWNSGGKGESRVYCLLET